MSRDPFSEPSDGERTIIRPAPRPVPGGRPTQGPPPAELTVITRPASAAVLHGGNPLTEAASTLLALLPLLRDTCEPPAGRELASQVRAELRDFEDRAAAGGVDTESIGLAHFVLCASVDDVVRNTPWGGGPEWADANGLVASFHSDVRDGDRFFDVLRKASARPARFMPVVELMFLCLSLGFAGALRGTPALEQRRQQALAVIAAASPAPARLSPQAAGVAAPWQRARRRVPLWVLAALAATAVVLGFVLASARLNATSDALYARMLAAPPATMPLIARAPRTPPPAPPVAHAASDAIAAALAADIAPRGPVELDGTRTAPLVRVADAALFSRRGATLRADAAPLLNRLAAALRGRAASVRVIGFTDDAPLRTLAFPSAYALSAAQARAVAGALRTRLGMLVAAEGRGAAEPVVANTDAAARARNRRIELEILPRPPTP